MPQQSTPLARVAARLPHHVACLLLCAPTHPTPTARRPEHTVLAPACSSKLGLVFLCLCFVWRCAVLSLRYFCPSSLLPPRVCLYLPPFSFWLSFPRRRFEISASCRRSSRPASRPHWSRRRQCLQFSLTMSPPATTIFKPCALVVCPCVCPFLSSPWRRFRLGGIV